MMSFFLGFTEYFVVSRERSFETLCFLTQLSAAIKDREASWRRQKSELEEHYNNLIKDLHTRTQVCHDQQPV